ncbi:MAG: hypothetical protein M3540_03900, partial [Actinomycetota bacterium]|nr:hypothetical protein [Actinomycetota bacterium]
TEAEIPSDPKPDPPPEDEVVSIEEAPERSRTAETRFAAAAPQAVFSGQLTASMWAEISLERNPFALGPNESTPLTIAASAVAETTFRRMSAVALTGTVDATLSTEDGAQTDGDDRVLVGKLACTASGTSEVDGNVEEGGGDTTFGIELRLRDATGVSPRLLVTISTPAAEGDFGAEITADWNESRPATIGLGIWLPPGKREAFLAGATDDRPLHEQGFPVATVDLDEDAELAKPTNHVHATAVAALEEIAKGLAPKKFGETETAKLFPDPEVVEIPELVATRDWVLFQRRRTADCNGAPPPAPVTNDRYLVFERSMSDQQLAAVARLGFGPTPASGLANLLTPIGEVEFADGSPSLVSPTAAILADWQAATPGPRIVMAAVATTDPSEADSLLLKRVRAYEKAVESVSSVAPNASIQVIPKLAQLAQGATGVIVLATDTTTICHHVYIARSSVDQPQGIIDELKRTGDLAQFLTVSESLDAGRIEFDAGTATVRSSAVTDLEDFQREVDRVVVVASPDAPGEPLREQVHAVIADMEGVPWGDPIGLDVVKGVGQWEDECPFVSVVFGTVHIN